jgi:hypothetical protein
MSDSVRMNASTSPTNATENLQSAFDVMYHSFMANNDLRDATQHILDLATHLTGAENSSLMLLNGHGQLYVLNSRGLRSAALKSPLVNVGEGIAGQVVEQGTPLLVEDIASDERFSSSYRLNRRKTNSFIACPITSREKVIGVLNLNEKKSGEPFDSEDFDQAQLISLMAATALRSFLGDNRIKFKSGDLDDIYHRLVEAECNNREFIACISHDIRTPLNNIKGAVYYLRNTKELADSGDLDFYEIIEKEVNYLISYLDESLRDYEHIQIKLADIEEREKYKNLLTHE